MSGESQHFYRFKSFRLDVEERRLLHNNSPVPLTPKAFDVLVVLVERSGHLVEKDELMQTVWSDSFVEEANIPRLIHTLRKVLGDDGGDHRFIETVAKKGYRFVAKVTEVSDSAAVAGINADASDKSIILPAVNFTALPDGNVSRVRAASPEIALPSAEESIKTPRALFFLAGFVTAIIVLLFFLVKIETVQPVASLPRDRVRSIAVLPPKPVETAKRDELYEIGIADSLIHRLSLMKGLVIRPLSATRKYAAGYDPAAAGREQQVDYVLVSSYQLVNGKIRLTAQLFNIATGQIDETYRSEKDDTGVMAIQDAVADEVAELLQTRFASASAAAPPEP